MILSGDRELLTVVNRRSANCALRLDMPITDALSKLNCLRNSQMRFCFSRTAHAICRGRRSGRWSVNCGSTRIVLADQRASTSLEAMAFNRRLGHSGLRIISEVGDSASDFLRDRRRAAGRGLSKKQSFA